MNSPETSQSLLFRLRNPADADAWQEFAEIYRPVIVRMASVKGLQTADAEDLAQKVLVSILGAIKRWDPSGQAKFRTWLKRITENAILNAITRTKPDRANGGDLDQSLLDEHPDRNGPDSELLRIEFRREIFHWAARRVRSEFTETTWKAFWLTAVEACPAEEVGRLLGRNRGSIYAARSRVMKRLIQIISEFETPEEDNE